MFFFFCNWVGGVLHKRISRMGGAELAGGKEVAVEL